ncbi:hypothetical protein [Fusibacter sp. 3D3]|uniref:hypothetical protein n=1 Tax=Fusibacter sp. 3D3 TaxID=1048380 RepID=UPI0015867A06|nr:hypothetical protein [Fusibacter sp. 3D3]
MSSAELTGTIIDFTGTLLDINKFLASISLTVISNIAMPPDTYCVHEDPSTNVVLLAVAATDATFTFDSTFVLAYVGKVLNNTTIEHIKNTDIFLLIFCNILISFNVDGQSIHFL